MSLRQEFEKLYLGANPQLARRNSTDDSYVLPSINDAWAGFQAGHAAGLEDAAKYLDDNRLEGRAAAIRAIKEEKNVKPD